jgi:hypothetical protein
MILDKTIYKNLQLPVAIKIIVEKVFESGQISTADALELYNCSNLALLGVLQYS